MRFALCKKHVVDELLHALCSLVSESVLNGLDCEPGVNATLHICNKRGNESLLKSVVLDYIGDLPCPQKAKIPLVRSTFKSNEA